MPRRTCPVQMGPTEVFGEDLWGRLSHNARSLFEYVNKQYSENPEYTVTNLLEDLTNGVNIQDCMNFRGVDGFEFQFSFPRDIPKVLVGFNVIIDNIVNNHRVIQRTFIERLSNADRERINELPQVKNNTRR